MIRSLLALLLFATGLSAAPAPTRGLEVRFLAERCPDGLGQLVLAADEQRSAEFDLPSNFLSTPVKPPARTFNIRALKPDVSLATVTLPEDGKSFVIVLIPAKESGYKTIVIRTDDAKFKTGDVYFYNHSDKVIIGFVGTAKFSLNPASGMVLTPKGARKENFFDVGFGVREEQGTRALSNTRWPVDDKVRSYVFFFVNPVTKRLDFRVVDEFVPPPVKGDDSP
jgi:hypothetical protein